MTVLPTNVNHENLRNDILAVIHKHGEELSAREILAISAYIVGQVVAFQNQNEITPTQAMDIVAKNIELGNTHAIKQTFGESVGNG